MKFSGCVLQMHLTPKHTSVFHWEPLYQFQTLIWEYHIPSWSFLAPRHCTSGSQDSSDSHKVTGMQTDTETHGCVGKLLGGQRDKLEWTVKGEVGTTRETRFSGSQGVVLTAAISEKDPWGPGGQKKKSWISQNIPVTATLGHIYFPWTAAFSFTLTSQYNYLTD